ncbi:MAG: DNA polymerase III subunit alpha [Bacteroidetes bacterium HGW-Bacteroidetes-2]|jgi:DNA polymerase-3 subunit alpha|nr:MAG: DNA polymerase III subunit alpha [Bacteroidetes bacterium HGW-Bacteroidetes-2]
MYLIFDTETTGLPKNYKAPVSDTDNWPRCIQIAWQLHDIMGNLIEHQDFLIKPDGFNIPFDAEKIHGISTELAEKEGKNLEEILYLFNEALAKAKFIVGQNVGFDVNIIGAEFFRKEIKSTLSKKPVLDTCTEATAFLCKLPGGRGGKFKLPTLTELHRYLFHQPFAEAHNATADVEATTRCFLELVRRKVFTEKELEVQPDYFENFLEANPQTIQLVGIKHVNLKKASEKIRKAFKEDTIVKISSEDIQQNISDLEEVPFAHLHNHSQYSILQSTSSTQDLVAAAALENMPAIAITDTGNMMGAFHFVQAVANHNAKAKAIALENPENLAPKPLKAIVGCEFFVCEDHANKNTKDNGYQIVLLAKNKKGYHNLAKMASIAYTQGFYYVPRVDKKIIEKYKDDILVLTGSLYGEVPGKILNLGENQAEEALLWWKETFGEDLYMELTRHNQEDEDRVNPVLIQLAKKHSIKLVAANNTYYINQEDANAHDILLCVKDGEKQATPIGRGKGYRYGLPNQEYYFKSTAQMKALFNDLPEAISNVQEIIDKVEPYTLAREVLLPKYSVPEQFAAEKDPDGKAGQNAYLKYLTYQGAKIRYPEITPEITERIDFELDVIAKTGYPGYFLIVQDFIAEARRIGVSVGPGRGSAAGSAVAYCLKITNIDPIKYDLLFERFLNPDRVSLPDIDIDFDDEGRSKVMDYVIHKYGASQVAQIITYGTMGGKSAIRDTARVLDLPLGDADRIAKLIPLMTKLNKIFGLSESELRQHFRSEDLEKVNELLNLSEGNDLVAQTINQAKILEGSLRNTGIHACGVIITPSDITDFVPVATAKDSDLYVTQFDNSVVESAGLLKMDFLGLKNLTIIKDAIQLIKLKRKIDLDPDSIPLDDEKTFELFQKGETVATFQYESAGMQKYMKDLKPTVFADLIAMNALYRPGPIEYIPSFIRRKNEEEAISYDLPVMEKYLKETYGITVYQEQVMLLSQQLAGFTKGDADVLRKAMGKKIITVLDKMKPKFLEGGATNGHQVETLEKIWKDWEAFASYAFNKSHSTCYALIGYQTAYLKANYPAEYMAAVLSNNMSDIKEVTKFMEECKRMGLAVLGPDVNESYYKFTVNNKGAVRFGMGAVKGVGANAVATIVENRKEGIYKSVFDLAKRIDLRAANKKAFENLALAGGFDSFDTHRAQYLHDEGDGVLFLEKVLRYAARYQENENSSQVSLFGDASDVQIPEPLVPPCEEWGTMKKLKLEKEVIGIYISGHPLDDFKTEITTFCKNQISDFFDLNKCINKEIIFGGVISEVQHRVAKNGNDWAMFTVEDYTDAFTFRIFGEEYLKYRHLLSTNGFIFARVSVKEGYINRETGKKSDPRMQFSSMQMLQEVLEKQSKKLTIHFQLNELKKEQIESLKNLLRMHKGSHNLDFHFFEPEEKIQLQMSSRKQKIKISQELLNELQKENFLYKLN